MTIKFYEPNTYTDHKNNQECLVVIERGYKHFARYVHWDMRFPEWSKQYTIGGAVLGKLKVYFREIIEKEITK